VVLAAVAVTQAVLLGLVLLTSTRGNRTANRLLAALLLTIGALIGVTTLIRSPYIVVVPHLVRVNHPMDFLLGPLLFLYVRAVTGNGRDLSLQAGRQDVLRPADGLHFLPAVACALYLLPYYAQNGAHKLADLGSAGYTRWYLVRSGLAIAIGCVYVGFAVRYVVRFMRNERQPLEQESSRGARQLQFLCAGFLGVAVVAAGRFVLDASLPAYMPITGDWLPAVGTTILCGMAYLGLRDPVGLSATPPAGAIRKYETSSLTGERAERGLHTLLHSLEVDRAYLDPDLTLSSLAARLRMPVSHVSQIINERLHQSFTDLINRYRVEEAKRRIVDPAWQHYSLLAIAEEVGFRSKSSFNAVFKKHTQMTPSMFRDQQRPDA
jgi:AraC-like DNA-binding protein